MARRTYVLLTFRNPARVIPGSLRLPFCGHKNPFTFSSNLIPAEMVHLCSSQVVVVSNFVLVTQAAFFSWNRVVRENPVDHGPYDANLIAPAVFVTSAVVIALESIGALGATIFESPFKKGQQHSSNGPTNTCEGFHTQPRFCSPLTYPLYTLAVISINLGGVLNATAHFPNE
ncbi:hypothetical protein BJ742DRAFT_866249 [Cladochytrium replicatum]|nr:hypothetical protein BJ742DRAFT_866249 [Cladochytrium replicatum]